MDEPVSGQPDPSPLCSVPCTPLGSVVPLKSSPLLHLGHDLIDTVFRPPPTLARDIDSKNLERLKACFLKDCRRLDPYNYVSTMINQHILCAVLRDSNASTKALLQDDCPELMFLADSRLESLHGRHRIQVARDVLPLTEKRWTDNVYLSGTSFDASSQDARLYHADVSRES